MNEENYEFQELMPEENDQSEQNSWTAEDEIENEKLMKKSQRKVISFLIYVFLLIIFFIIFRQNELFIFRSQTDSNAESSFMFLFLTYTVIVGSFIYLFFFVRYYFKRKKKSHEEQMTSFSWFQIHFGIFDLLGVIPVFLAILTLINGLFLGFATVHQRSMVDTLCEGDLIVIDHYTQNYERNDILIFNHEDASGNTEKIIKRLIGLPGDYLKVDENGVYLAEADENGDYGDLVLIEAYIRTGEDVFVYDGVIPEGYFFFLGDNRCISFDSRYAEYGLISESQVLGEELFHIKLSSCTPDVCDVNN